MTPKIFLQRAGTQTLWTYVDRRQAKVVEWVALRSIFDVYAIETVYEGWGETLSAVLEA